MAIIFAEGFDHYGTIQYNPTAGPYYGNVYSDSVSRYNMLSGVWAEVPLSAKCYYEDSYENGDYPFRPRTGKSALGFLTGTSTVHLRRTLFGYKGTGGDFIGVAFAVWVAQLPTSPGTQVLVSFLDSETLPNVAFILQPDGSITANVPHRWAGHTSNNWNDTPNDLPYPDGSSGSYEIASTLPGVFVAGTWNHIEVKVAIGTAGDTYPGQVLLRLNEEEMAGFDQTDVTTLGDHSTGTSSWEDNDAYVSQVSFLYNYSSSTNQLPIFLDDIVCWDSTGTNCITDWIGDKNVVLEQFMFDNSDATYTGMAGAWGVSGVGAGEFKEAIDDFNDPDVWTADPYDDPVLYPVPFVNGRDETTYLVASAINQEVEVATDAPTTLTDIDAVILVNSLRKTQASTTKVQASFVAGSHTSGDGTGVVSGLDRPVAQDFTYYQDILERAPGNTPWTAAILNAGKVRIKRTA